MLSAWNVFMSGDEDDPISEVHRERCQPLVDIKSHYDRDNFFRLNQNFSCGIRRQCGGRGAGWPGFRVCRATLKLRGGRLLPLLKRFSYEDVEPFPVPVRHISE